MAREPDPAIRATLADVEPVRNPGDLTVRDRCLATADAESYRHARAAVPELIVEKLAGEDGADGFYADLLEKFE